MREVEFHAPVYVGDIVNFFTETVRVGQTSVTVKALVEVERWSGGHGEHETDTARHSRDQEVPRCLQRPLPRLVTLTRPRPWGCSDDTRGRVSVTEAEVVLVAIGSDGRPIQVRPGAGPA